MSTNTALDQEPYAPRPIGTFTKLLEVRQGTVVLDKGGAVMKLEPSSSGPYGRWLIAGEAGDFPYSSVHLPAVVLHEPEAEVTR